MADISKITLPSGTTYDIKDKQARDDIAAIESAIAGGVTFVGETTTALTDGSTVSTITVNGNTFTAIKGSLVVYDSKEFVYDGTKWIELGDLSLIGDLGWKDSASGSYTPAGTVSQPTFTGTELTSTGSYTPSGSISLKARTASGISLKYWSDFKLTNAVYSTSKNVSTSGTPNGSVSAPTISVKTAGSTATVNSITAVGTLPALGATVSNEVLTLSWDAGTLPTKGSDTTVKTTDAEYEASQPSFTGSSTTFSGTLSVPTSVTTFIEEATPSTVPSYGFAFAGTSKSVSVTGTPSGTVSQPTFTGTEGTVTVT